MPFSVYLRLDMKKSLKTILAILALLLTASILFVGCTKEKSSPAPDYSALDLGEYVTLGEYKDLQISLGGVVSEDMTNDVVLWETIVNKAEVIKYPDKAVSYYKDQAIDLYMGYAEKGSISYDELMSSLGKTDKDIEAEAKEYVKSDLVSLAIIEAEGLHLTEDEKTRLFDKYAYKFTTTYGYTVDYVYENLKNEIYESMQFDKMMEFLLLNNEIIAITEEE